MEQAAPVATPVAQPVVEITETAPQTPKANAELTVDLLNILDEVDKTETVEALKALFDRHKVYLDYMFMSPVIGQEINLRMAIMVRKSELEDGVNAGQ
jgi:hypothetical protein